MGNFLPLLFRSRPTSRDVDGLSFTTSPVGSLLRMDVERPAATGQQDVAIGSQADAARHPPETPPPAIAPPMRRRIAAASSGMTPSAVGPTFNR